MGRQLAAPQLPELLGHKALTATTSAALGNRLIWAAGSAARIPRVPARDWSFCAATRCPGPGRRGRTAGSTWPGRGASRCGRRRAQIAGRSTRPGVPDIRRHRVRVRVPGAFRPRRWAAYPAQLLDGPLLNLVCDARDALRERLPRHRGHALAAAVGRVQHRRDLAREIRPLRVADVGDRPAGVTKIIEHGRQRLAQLAVHEMPLPGVWHTGCQAGTTESTIPRAQCRRHARVRADRRLSAEAHTTGRSGALPSAGPQPTDALIPMNVRPAMRGRRMGTLASAFIGPTARYWLSRVAEAAAMLNPATA